MAQRIVNNSLLDVKPQLNLLANGGFEQWNFGTSFNGLTTSGTRIAEGWVTNASGNTLNINRESTEIASLGSKYSLKFQVVTPAGSNAKVLNSTPRVDLIGKKIFASIQVKTTIANGIRIELSDGVTAAYSAYHTGSGNWETLMVSLVPGSTMSVLHFAIGFELTTVTTGIFYADNAMVVMSDKAVDYVPENPELDKVKTGLVADVGLNVPNILVNGGFEIWQRGTSFSSPANLTYTADRWVYLRNGVTPPTAVISQQSSSSVHDFGNGAYGALIAISSAGSGSDSCCLYQDVEVTGGLRRKGRGPLTVTARVKTNIANRVRIKMHDGVTAVYGAYHNGDDTWQTLTCTITPNLGSASIIRVYVGINEESGYGTGNIYIDSVMLTYGTTPISFYPEDYQIELARCQRFYEKASISTIVTAIQRLTSSCVVYSGLSQFKQSKSAVPTITVTGFVCAMRHLPNTGNTEASPDTANWTAAGYTPTTENVQFVLGRTVDQTTYPLLAWGLTWAAEV